MLLLGLTLGSWAQNGSPYEVLISEILFDPNPVVGLGGFEYAELYNAGQDSIRLESWTWQVGNKSISLPDIRMGPGELVVIAPQGSSFPGNFPAVWGLEKWLILPNSGQYVCLINPKGQLSHFLDYSPGMHVDALKRDGGWSLELQNLFDPCSNTSWRSSKQPDGGSPGLLPLDPIEGLCKHKLYPMRFGFIQPNEWILYWSDFLHPATRIGDLVWESADLQVHEWLFQNNRLDQMILRTGFRTQNQVSGSIHIGGSALSCSGSELQFRKLRWGQPQIPDSGDLLISEVLFDPGPDGLEFVECYNASDKVIDLNEIAIATLDEAGVVKDFSRAGAGSVLIFPKEYLALCADPGCMHRSFPAAPPENIVKRSDIPSLVNSGSSIRLLSSRQIVLDQAVFEKGMHSSRLSETSGVSLERLSFDLPGTDDQNWYSASSLSGRATPGMANSQHSFSENSQSEIWLENTTFSPNQDGFRDLMILHFDFQNRGFLGQVQIRTRTGLLVRELVDWELLPTRGQVVWDGMDFWGQACKSDIYILLFNYQNDQGLRGRFKKAVALQNY